MVSEFTFCMPRAMSALGLLPADTPAQVREEQAFRNYYEAFLDAKEQAIYLDCLKKRWRVPWLHSDYRKGQRWWKTSQSIADKNAPLAGPGKNIADVEESFSRPETGRTLRRVTIIFQDGTRKTVEESFASNP